MKPAKKQISVQCSCGKKFRVVTRSATNAIVCPSCNKSISIDAQVKAEQVTAHWTQNVLWMVWAIPACIAIVGAFLIISQALRQKERDRSEQITDQKTLEADTEQSLSAPKAKPATNGAYAWPKDQPAPAIAPFNAEEAKAHQEAWAKHLNTEVETANSIGMKFRVIPPGEFLMGSSDEEIEIMVQEAKSQMPGHWYVDAIQTEGPQHQVTITKPFGLSIHEVTRGQFRKFVEATGYKTDAEKDGKGSRGSKNKVFSQSPEFLWNTKIFETEQTDDHPVISVSWNDAMAFCDWLSKEEGVTYRLPTEAEWEFACRAGSQTRFSYGDEEFKLGDYAWYDMQGGTNTMPVGMKAPNALGVFDLYGNVWEWCYDLYGPYTTKPAVDPLGSEDDSNRSSRGGAFSSSAPARSALRNRFEPTKRSYHIGFRIVRTIDKPAPKSKATHVWPKNQPAPAIAPFNAKQAKTHQEEWAEHLGVEVEIANSIDMKFRVIPPGEFLMGSSDEEISELLDEAKVEGFASWYTKRIPTERPQHVVILTEPFGFAAHEVTRGQFRQFVDATGYKTDAEKDGLGGSGFKNKSWVQATEFLWNTNVGFETEQTDDHPVINVSWNDAVAFCKWLSEKEGVTYQLPTEAQWEFACRAGSHSSFSFGNEVSRLSNYAWNTNQGGIGTKPVGKKRANALGLFDLHGNVSEWCRDWSGLYIAAPAVNPLGPFQGSTRLLRGGTFSVPSSFDRSARRFDDQPTSRNINVGFRVSRTYD